MQPVTENVKFETNNELVELLCDTPGSSIAWRYKGEGNPDQWFLYMEKIQPVTGKIIEAQAIRIGFKHSKITEKQY